ncbi:MAG: phasin family protein [Ferrovibrio sp.]|uniref:phasin family protein n=1 Tax=Ferrovibrio sp. TaxID=1917215 RepID=UPI00260BAA9E|nr:phasin family protein [Ferrovibrio sp.]MCW0233398.1 phasin family protein [Ferrovibrio sp.]
MATKKKIDGTETEALTANPFEAAIFASKEQVEKAISASTEALEKAFSMSKDRFEDAAKMGKDQVEACVTAGNVATKGFETINAEVMAFTKTQIEDQISAAKAMMGAKTLQELIELQNGFAKSAFEAYTAHTTKLSEVATKVAQDAFAPINAQVQASVEKFVKPLAA